MIQGKHIVIDARIRPSSTGRYVDRLLHHLQNIDRVNKYTLIIMKDDPWKPTAKNFEVVRVRYEQFSFNPLDQLGFAFLLYRLRPDLVHFCSTQQPILYLGKIVTTTHDITMLENTRQKDWPLWVHKIKEVGYRFLMWWGHRKSNAIIVPTYSVKKDVVRHHGFTLPRIEVTYEASESPLEMSSQMPEVLDPNHPFICYVGTAFPHKNLKTLVLAFEHLAKQHPNLRLNFAGKKEFFYEELEEYVKSRPNVRDRINILGFIADEELKWLYENAKCYVFPTKAEGFGLPAIEAMVHGLPVTASNIPVLTEVLGDAAHYFSNDDPKSIANAVNDVLTKPQLHREMVLKGHKQIEKYSWERMAQETKKVYENVLSQ